MKRITISTLLAGLLALPAAAQEFEDEPGAGVARLSVADGDVIVQRGDTGEFISAERNAPLVALDHVITGEDARAEIQFDWANMIRLAENSEVRLGELADGDFFIQVAGGTVTFSVLSDSGTLVELSTATASVRPLEAGLYRLFVRPDGSTEVTIRSGSAELFTSARSQTLTAGMTIDVRGNPDNPQLVVLSPLPLDAWDQWNRDRDRDLLRSDVYQYVGRDVYGAEDLNRYGRWVYDAPYGYVWVPDVAATWAPYRVGRWTWVDYYGWTWVSGDPWGWAPYHYGRWYHAPRYGWVWYPGVVTVRQYWRPALVAFFGWGSGGARVNVSLSFGFGNVGWVPLAPYEVYRPWYGRRNTVRVNNITVVNNVNIVNTYRNARYINGRNGVTSIRTRDFGVRTVSDTNIVRVNERDLRRAGQVRGRVPVDPLPESRRLNEREVNTRAIARRNVDESRSVRRAETGPPDNSRVAQRADVAARAADVRAQEAARESRAAAQDARAAGQDARNGRGANRAATAQAAPEAAAGNTRAQQRESVAARAGRSGQANPAASQERSAPGADNNRRTQSNAAPSVQAGNGRGAGAARRTGEATAEARVQAPAERGNGNVSVLPSPRRAEADTAPANNSRAAQRSSVATRSGAGNSPAPAATPQNERRGTAGTVTTTPPQAAPERRAPAANSRAAERSSVATRSGAGNSPARAPQASDQRRATPESTPANNGRTTQGRSTQGRTTQQAPRQVTPTPQAAPERRAPQSAPANNSRAAQRSSVATRSGGGNAPEPAPQASAQRRATPQSAPAANSRSAQRGRVTQEAPRQSAPEPRASTPSRAPQSQASSRSTQGNSRSAQRGRVTQQAPRQSAPAASSSGGGNSRGSNSGGNGGGNGNSSGNNGRGRDR